MKSEAAVRADARYRERNREKLRLEGKAIRDAHKNDPEYKRKKSGYEKAFRERHREELRTRRRAERLAMSREDHNREAEEGRLRNSTPEGRAKDRLYHKRNHLKKYGLSLETFEHMFREQDGLCAVCGDRMLLGEGAVRGRVLNPARYVVELALQVWSSEGRPLTPERLKAAVDEDARANVSAADCAAYIRNVSGALFKA